MNVAHTLIMYKNTSIFKVISIHEDVMVREKLAFKYIREVFLKLKIYLVPQYIQVIHRWNHDRYAHYVD